MKKILAYFSLILVLGVAYVGYTNYPKLDIITGYASKMVASAVFVADRTQESVNKCDNNFSPINLASIEVNEKEKSVSATLYGLKKNKAVYREGLGVVVVTDDYDEKANLIAPQRNIRETNLAFPYGDMAQKDTIFANVNYDLLNKAVDNSFDINPDRIEGSRSVMVIYKDQIIAEKYAEGFDKETVLLGWSMTKTITSTMYGIMQKKGMVDINAKAEVPEWQNDERKEITYNNLLQMNSGLEWDENYNKISDVTKMLYLESDMSVMQREKGLTGKPNESWNYSSGTSNLLSGYLMRNKFESQQDYINFWYNELFDKIGMNSMILETDVMGNVIGSSYSWANTRDWAKFGLLYLHEGNWNGEQVIDSTWVDYAVTPTNTSGGNYGAQIWLNVDHSEYADAPEDLYFFDGYQGQRVFVIPSKDMVVVRMGINNTNKMDFNAFLKEVIGAVE
ncbi:MAG: serine hydrolase [Bacteroidota bacterium]